ncbi:MAG: hypothetical protein FIB07_08000 [Candidatus Methanoperedens sp.]|nr:hypothetical protein [Candidatus Methanoperedens sp.]
MFIKQIFLILIIFLISGCIDSNGPTPETQIIATTTYFPTPTPRLSPINTPSSLPTPEPVIITPTGETDFEPDKTFQRKFTWNYGGTEWYLTMNFDDGIYNAYKSRSHSRDYDLFASDPYDDVLIKSIATTLKKVGKDNGLTDSEIPYLTISFIQSLPYTSDKVTTGFDEYPRFPYETLYDDGGDCEDTSILATAILQEMGYGVVLIELPKHMAVGIKCSPDISGYSYNFNGQRYCYLETTGENWPVGQLPDEYKNSKAKIITIYARPVLDVKFTSKYEYNSKDVYTDVDVTVENLGSETAKNTKIYVALQTSDTSKVWSQIESQYVQIEPESSYTYNVKNLHAPTGRNFRIYVRAYGDNVISDEEFSNWITWTKN